MICTLSRQHAEARGYDDALMFDWRGQVAEATGANAFFVRDGAAAHADARLLPRRNHPQTVMDLARKRGVEVIERAIWPEELESFEQMFLTGSAAEVTFVRDRRARGTSRSATSPASSPSDYDDLVNGRIPNA